jgi:hypothetical protein
LSLLPLALLLPRPPLLVAVVLEQELEESTLLEKQPPKQEQEQRQMQRQRQGPWVGTCS